MADRNDCEIQKAEAGRLLESRIFGVSLGSTRRLREVITQLFLSLTMLRWSGATGGGFCCYPTVGSFYRGLNVINKVINKQK